jgi:exopolysaccharide production protein ExoQ
MHSQELRRASPFSSTIDLCTLVPILACSYAMIIVPLISFFDPPPTPQTALESGLINRIFWPAMAAISIVLASRNHFRIRRSNVPPHIVCLLAYLAFAGASVLWAFKPELSFIRFIQQVMIITSIILPAMAASRTPDLMRGLFICFAFASILNIFFIPNNPPSLVEKLGGYAGYLGGKNYLGEFSALAFLLSLHEVLYPGRRRALGIFIVIIAFLLLFLSNSKTAFGLALLVPFLAGTVLLVRKTTRISVAVFLLSIVFCYFAVSSVSGFNMNRVSYMLYGDSTFTGRTVIWDFVSYEIGRRPLLGWGYQSFWQVGLDGPSFTDGPGWVKGMPNAHNGYMDTKVELGYVGYALLITFIIATLHAIGRVADRDPARGWLVLSIVLYIVIYNYLESMWMRGYEMMWVVFVIVAAEIGRYWQRFSVAKAAHGPETPTLTIASRSPVARRPRL